MAAAAAAAVAVLNEEIADERRVCEDEKSAKNRFTSCRPATRVSTISGGGTGDLCCSCHTRVGACPLRRFRNDATRSFVRRAAAAAAVVVNVVGRTPVTGKNRPPPKTVFSKSRGRRGPSFNRAAHVDRSIRAPILSSWIILQDIDTDATRPGPDPREMHPIAGHRRSTDAAAVAAVLLCLACSAVTSAAEYYGKYLGPFKSYHHGLGGDVYAVDARTLHIRNFVYDGEGPAAYFYGSNGKQPGGSNGFRIRDEKASINPLKRYSSEHLTITVPEGLTLHDIKWFYVWCEDFSVNFGDVKIPYNLNYPKPQKIDRLSGIHGVSSENIVVVDAQTLLIPGFSYDGEAPDAKFWVGAGDKPTPQGVRVADENGKETPLRRYDHKTIVLTLPGDLTIFDIGHFSVWCEAFTVDFGHVIMPTSFNVPPSLKMLGVLPQSKLNCEVLHEPLGYEARWAIAGDSIVVQLVAKLEVNQYMSFGISGSPTTNRMVGADVVVSGVDPATISGFAQDYYLLDKSQCVVQQETGQVSGSCPDSNIQGPAGESVRLLNAAIVNGYSIVTYQRPLKSKDNLDLSILTNRSQPIIWAIGPLNDKREVSYHSEYSKETIKIDFGRSPEWNCPIPDTDAKSDAVRHDVTTVPTVLSDITTGQSLAKETTTKKIRPRPVAEPAPVPNAVAWDIPAVQCYEPDDGVFYAQMGPTGGKHGYSAITGHVGWGTSWYINGLLVPEINVVRGQTYTFVVEGGLDPEIPAKYHPFYITDDPVGGYGYKTAEERENIRIFAGVSIGKSGQVIPTGVGRSCIWTPDPQQPPSDEFVSFGAYQRTLTLVCDNGDPGIVQWTPDAETPDTVYYQCFTHRHLGWKINVLDSCDKEQPGTDAGQSAAAAAEDLQSRGSIQYTTRVKPDAAGGGKNYVDARPAPAKDHGDQRSGAMPPVPPTLEEHLRNDFRVTPSGAVHRGPFGESADHRRHRPAAPQQNYTLYAYPVSNYTYGGNVPFYMPKTHYGSPQPMKTSSSSAVYGNYRPIRQPAAAVPHFHVQQLQLPVQQQQPSQQHVVFTAVKQQPVAVKHGYRVQSGKRLPNGVGGHRHSVVYKKPVYRTAAAAALDGPPSAAALGHFQQPATSMSQSVSVSYSTSRHAPQPPVQSRQQEPFGEQHYYRSLPVPQQQQQFQGGFNPDTVVVEGGFKPIVPGGGVVLPQDRSDDGTAAEADTEAPRREKKMAKKLISRKPAAKGDGGDTVEKQAAESEQTPSTVEKTEKNENGRK